MQPTRPPRGLPGLRLLLAVALLLGIVLIRSAPSSASTSAGRETIEAAPLIPAAAPPVVETPRGVPQGTDGDADGVLPVGVTAFADRQPGVARLDPELLGALRDATEAAAADGVEIVITSGWRSHDYQARLLRQAVAEYGSKEQAARWVATPETSPHVAGDAVDIGHADAIAWLAAHGSRFGLCRIYRNEPWHFELRPAAASAGCPRMYADPAHDPRLNR